MGGKVVCYQCRYFRKRVIPAYPEHPNGYCEHPTKMRTYTNPISGKVTSEGVSVGLLEFPNTRGNCRKYEALGVTA